MKFWYSSTSPFARKVYVTILHHHLEEQVDIRKFRWLLIEIHRTIKIIL